MQILVIAAAAVFCLLVLYYLYQGAAYVPTLRATVERMVGASGVRRGMRMADLGSGDGRIVIAFARAGAHATGFEINPPLVWYSRHKIKKLGLTANAHITTSNFWNQSLREYDIVTVFGINHMMNRLEKKLLTELRPGTIIISNAFRLPHLKLKEVTGSLLIYQI
ncbi:MAG: class I SAM-dependent methyltransferase [Candidatus Doudnabacteria bacterium]|nr:class I SAM-dependent methyltransferase [Candidatus Doudnabacteria bacterium]